MKTEEKIFLEELFSKMREFQPIPADFRPRQTVNMKADMPENLKLAWLLAVFEGESNRYYADRA